MTEPVRILFLSADPSDKTRTRLGEEHQRIQDALRGCQSASRGYLLESDTSARTDTLARALHIFRPEIVHFAGHGTMEGDLCFEDETGNAQRVAPEPLADLFSLVADEVDCVILNACFSEPQARAIAAHIPHVIGIKTKIYDRDAIQFSIGFYQAIVTGRAVAEAYRFGCALAGLGGSQKPLMPVLLEGKFKRADFQRGDRQGGRSHAVEGKNTDTSRRTDSDNLIVKGDSIAHRGKADRDFIVNRR